MSSSKGEQPFLQWRKGALYSRMYGRFTTITLQACAYSSRSEALYRIPLQDLKGSIYRWVTEELELLGPLPPLEQPKKRLFNAFTELAANQRKFPFTDKDPTHCPVCGNKLVTAYTEPLVCERCMQPVLDALDDLVRATTTEWTPEELRESYLNALKSVPESGD